MIDPKFDQYYIKYTLTFKFEIMTHPIESEIFVIFLVFLNLFLHLLNQIETFFLDFYLILFTLRIKMTSLNFHISHPIHFLNPCVKIFVIDLSRCYLIDLQALQVWISLSL